MVGIIYNLKIFHSFLDRKKNITNFNIIIIDEESIIEKKIEKKQRIVINIVFIY